MASPQIRSAPAWVTRSCSGSSISRWCTISPGVGENLQDHLEMYLQYECKEPVSLYPALQWVEPAEDRRRVAVRRHRHRRQQPVRSGRFYPQPRRVRLAEHSVPLPAGGD
ncbi:hypothetical protein ACHWWK_06470 [Klebsiella pneumoniae]